MKGTVAKAHIAIANGSPWIAPSGDMKWSPSMNIETAFLLVLMRKLEITGHKREILIRAN